jgi:hypothetical protein
MQQVLVHLPAAETNKLFSMNQEQGCGRSHYQRNISFIA